MTLLPISSPTPVHRETLYSYLARLAAAWWTETPELAYDMGAPFRRLLNQDEEAFGNVADWAKLAPDTMEELLSWTGIRAGNVRMKFRGELYVSRALRNPVMRGCPVCLREDAAGTSGPPHGAMAMRGDWQFREVTLCLRHGHPLVPLWTAAAPRDRFDIGARLREIEANILSGALDQRSQAPSPYDIWLNQRLEDGSDTTWFRDHPVFAVTTLCRLLGQALLKDDTPEDDSPSGGIHAVGFNVAVRGEAAIRDALDQIAAMATGAWDEPQKAFGLLYSSLNRNYLKEPGFFVFREILRDCILDNWPLAAGEMVLGTPLPERRFHSLRTAARETGIGPTVLEHFLTEAGAIPRDDPRPPGRRLFDAQVHAGLLAEIPTLVGPIAMRTAMGATKMELIALEEAGVLTPRTRVETVKNPWRMSDGLAFVAELSEGAVTVEDEDKDWEPLLLARRRSELALDTLVGAIRDKRLSVGQRAGVPGFHGIVVPKSEVNVLAAPARAARNEVLEEVPGSMAAAQFGRAIGLRDGGVFQAMIEAGHVTAYQVINLRTRRPQYRMTPEHMAAFHHRFVTLTTLSAETGKHRNTLKGILLSRGIAPFSPEGHDFGSVYQRGDVIGVVRQN